ncbi:NAD(P)/FAD-dependent oxidoreductase [Kribbella yunnanensis]
MNVEVVVVGAGPVGLATAVALRQNGHEVAVVDKLAAGANTSRAAVIHAGTMDVLESIGVTKSLLATGLPLPQFAIRDGDKLLAGFGFRSLRTNHPYTLTIPQTVTEAVLLERLEELGGSVLRPRSAVGLTQDANGAQVTLDTGDVINAQYVVAADGVRSTIRELVGIAMPIGTPMLSASLIDVRIDGGLRTDEVTLYFAQAGVLVVAPFADGSFRLVAATPDAPEHPDVAYAQQLVDVRGPKSERPIVTDIVWGSRFRVYERVADRYREGRVLLAGDAAHTHSPVGGQGMNLGLRDAVRLGGALSTALTSGDESELDAYVVQGRAEAVEVVALAHRLTRVANAPRLLRPLRNLILGRVGRSESAKQRVAQRIAGLAGSRDEG